MLPSWPPLARYDIECVIATSPLAVVYRACDRASQQVVALKEYLPTALATRTPSGRVAPRGRREAQHFERGRQAFVAEAQVLARVDHAALLRVLAVLDENGTVYRVMRFSPGPSLLAHRQALGAAPSPQDFKQWLDGLLDALAALHHQGCTHGAVLPGNILLRHGDGPLLLDFCAVQQVIADAHPVVTAADDLHALAQCLHYSISGVLPQGPDGPFKPLAEAWQAAGGALPIADKLAKVFAAIDACLVAAPANRPTSVAMLRNWLAQGGPAKPALLAETPMVAAAAGLQVAPDAAADVIRSPAPMPNTAAANDPGQQAAPALATALDDLPPATDAGQPEPLDLLACKAQPLPAPAPAPVAPASVAPATVAPGLAALPLPAGSVPAGSSWRQRMPWRIGLALALVTGLALGWLRLGVPLPPTLTETPVAANTPAPMPMPAPAARLAQATLPIQAASPAPSVSAALPVTQAVAAAPATIAAPTPATAPGRQAAARPPAVPVRQQAAAQTATASLPPATRSPRQVCGAQAGFALYQCMQQQCAKAGASGHAQCQRLRQSDALD